MHQTSWFYSQEDGKPASGDNDDNVQAVTMKAELGADVPNAEITAWTRKSLHLRIVSHLYIPLPQYTVPAACVVWLEKGVPRKTPS